jgi:ABC-type sugar transport system ATPase subunit
MSGIAFEHVSKVFSDGTAAVAGLDLRVSDGEFCVLLGPSGCGKSTVLRLVAGLEEVTRGVIRIGDRVVNDVPPGDRGVAMVFESFALYPHMTVAENMGFPLRAAREPAAPQRDRVRRTAGRLGLGGLLDRRPRQLSDGERQRVALGRAIVRRPEAFLMDEPLSGLDSGTRTAMRAAIARLHRDSGATVLYVTHDQSEAMSLADRVAVLHDGRLEQVGEPQELYDRPATLFVASFLGSPPMNLWHMRLERQDGRVALVGGDQRLHVPAAVLHQRPGLRSHVGGHLIVGLRPEAFTAAERAGSSALDLPVAGVRPLGPHMLVELEAEGAGLQLAAAGDVLRAGVEETPGHAGTATFVRSTATLTASLPPHTHVVPGKRLRLFVNLQRAHFFDPATQYALG